MNTIALKTSVYTALSAYGTVYEMGAVPSKAANPYIVYSLGPGVDGLKDDAYCRQITLHIDMYYRNESKNTDALEALSDSIENGLRNRSISGTGFVYDLLQPIKNEGMPTSDEFMFRRRLSYTMKFSESE